MKSIYIKLTTVDDVYTLVKSLLAFDGDVDLVSGRYIVDGRSLLGIFSLDLTKPVELVFHDEEKAPELYELLKKLTGHRPPWGSLTGIRPTRLLYERLDAGLTLEEAQAYVETAFDVSREKADLLRRIVIEQQKLPQPSVEEADVYISIPFCRTRCAYCSFPGEAVGKGKLIPPYLEALLWEMKEGAEFIVKEKLYTHGEQVANTDFVVDMNGKGCRADVMSRSVAADNSKQHFVSTMNGNAACYGHTECDAIIMDKAQVTAAPCLSANDVDAELIHEAAIGKIAGEQLIKLMTLGLTEREAEEQIIKGFLH